MTRRIIQRTIESAICGNLPAALGTQASRHRAIALSGDIQFTLTIEEIEARLIELTEKAREREAPTCLAIRKRSSTRSRCA